MSGPEIPQKVPAAVAVEEGKSYWWCSCGKSQNQPLCDGSHKGSEFVRFSGVVNPDYVRAGNVVPSTQVADARIEYRTNSRIDASQVMSILTRFFLSIAPL